MALQNKSGNIQMDNTRNIKLLKSKTLGIGNENILPGKSLSNVSKIPTRSVLGTVNANRLPNLENKTNNAEFLKPVAPLKKISSTKSINSATNISQNILPNSKKFHSGSNISQNVIRKDSLLKPNIPKTIQSAKPAAPKSFLKAPNKETSKPRTIKINRTDSTASLFSSQNVKITSSDILKCEQELNNVSLEEDIDEKDVDDPFQLGCYVKDIYNYLFKLEKDYIIEEDYLRSKTSGESDGNNGCSGGVQRSIVPKYRTILVDYMIDMQIQYELFPETLFLAVYLMDKYLELEPSITKHNLQCVGVTAMFLASKYEEVMMPDVSEYSAMTENHVQVKDILSMEVLIVQKLGFNFNRPHPLSFLRRFSKAAKADNVCHNFAKYFIEISINEYDFVHELPSKIAAAALYLAHIAFQPTINLANIWSKTLVHYSRYTLDDIMPVVKRLAVAVMENASEKTPKYRAVKDKYAKSINKRVSQNPSVTEPCSAIKRLAAQINE